MAARARLSARARRAAPSPIQAASRLAQELGAVNLAEGFPDFPAPDALKQAATAAIAADHNQYRHVQSLCNKVAASYTERFGVPVDPLRQFWRKETKPSSSPPLMKPTLLALPWLEDLFNMWAWILPVGPSLAHNWMELSKAAQKLLSSTGMLTMMIAKGLVEQICSETSIRASLHVAACTQYPHNPSGKVFTKSELAEIAAVCCKYDLLAITDEVYEHLTYGDARHVSLASLPGMRERTIITSSLSKTFSVTGWRVGWAIAPADISAAIGSIHVKLTDSAPSPFQEAALAAFDCLPSYYQQLRQDYEVRKDFVCNMLIDAGFVVDFKPEGGFFVFAQLPSQCKLTDVDFVGNLIRKEGVAIVPGSGFFCETTADAKGSNDSDRGALCSAGQLGLPPPLLSPLSGGSEHPAILRDAKEGRAEVLPAPGSSPPSTPSYMGRYVRVAFCKDMATLQAASQRLRRLIHQADSEP
eukprot:SM000100S09455  [mRNA]  locus=s100:470326:473828:- [translate_table: standard]